MWELEYKESWEPKKWCFWTVVLEKTLDSPLDFKEIQPVHSKGISPEYSLEGLLLKLKLQYFGHLMQKADSLEKTQMLGKIEGGRRRGRQDEMVGWHHQLNGHESEQALGVGDGQGSLVCYVPWGHKESNTAEQVNWTELILKIDYIKKNLIKNHWQGLKEHKDNKFYHSVSHFPLMEHTLYFGEGHGTPLQYSCLENPMDRGAWWSIAHGFAKSRTWLKRLSSHTRTLYLPDNILNSWDNPNNEWRKWKYI